MCITSQLGYSLCGCIYPLPPRYCYHARGSHNASEFCESVVLEPTLVVRDEFCPGCEDEWVRGLEIDEVAEVEKSTCVGVRVPQAGAEEKEEKLVGGGDGVDEEEEGDEVGGSAEERTEGLGLKKEVREALKAQLLKVCEETSGIPSAPAEEVTLRRRGKAQDGGSGNNWGSGRMDARALEFVPGKFKSQREPESTDSLRALVAGSQEDSSMPPSTLETSRVAIRRPTPPKARRMMSKDTVEVSEKSAEPQKSGVGDEADEVSTQYRPADGEEEINKWPTGRKAKAAAPLADEVRDDTPPLPK